MAPLADEGTCRETVAGRGEPRAAGAVTAGHGGVEDLEAELHAVIEVTDRVADELAACFS